MTAPQKHPSQTANDCHSGTTQSSADIAATAPYDSLAASIFGDTATGEDMFSTTSMSSSSSDSPAMSSWSQLSTVELMNLPLLPISPSRIEDDMFTELSDSHIVPSHSSSASSTALPRNSGWTDVNNDCRKLPAEKDDQQPDTFEPTPLGPPHSRNIVPQIRFGDHSRYWKQHPDSLAALQQFADFLSGTSSAADGGLSREASLVTASATQKSPTLAQARFRRLPAGACTDDRGYGATVAKALDRPSASAIAVSTLPATDERIIQSNPLTKSRFGTVQARKWETKYRELVQFVRDNGHAVVPLEYKANPSLAHWTKRQRAQHKKYVSGKASSMTPERVQLLERVGFVWNSHKSGWNERFGQLQDFRNTHRHTNVPSSWPANPELSVWVKCQRRQYRLWQQSRKSNMTRDRIDRLNSIGFVWLPRQNASSGSVASGPSDENFAGNDSHNDGSGCI